MKSTKVTRKMMIETDDVDPADDEDILIEESNDRKEAENKDKDDSTEGIKQQEGSKKILVKRRNIALQKLSNRRA
eukprot:gene2073-2350_t